MLYTKRFRLCAGNQQKTQTHTNKTGRQTYNARNIKFQFAFIKRIKIICTKSRNKKISPRHKSNKSRSIK